MTRFRAIGICLLGVTFFRPIHAMALGLGDASSGVGAGIILGEPTGLSFAMKPSPSWFVDGAVAWSLPEGSIHLHADYLLLVANFEEPQVVPPLRFSFYVGAGARMRLGEGYYESNEHHPSLLALRVPVGMLLLMKGIPVDFFIELVPVLGLYPESRFDVDAAFGARVWFGGNNAD